MQPSLQRTVEFFSELSKSPSTVLVATKTTIFERPTDHGGNTYSVSILRNVITLPRKINTLQMSIDGANLSIATHYDSEMDLINDQIDLTIRIGFLPREDEWAEFRGINGAKKELGSILDKTISALLSPEYIPIDPHQICERIIEVIKQVDKYQVSKHENMA